MTISTEDHDFFVASGEHIATLRKVHSITQAQLADALGVSQQTVQAYEMGRRRIPVSAMPIVARTLAVPLEELFGQASRTAHKRGSASRLQQLIEAVSQLHKTQQRFISQMLDTVLSQAQR
ncbi:MAG: XRE family transcriptional regulator [Betaproteobacteria bacterium RBG_16_56_24]|nr:MAG: XRE family transcriptional regulator [Betaproteobacteria bacterium RBG_16_56_24]